MINLIEKLKQRPVIADLGEIPDPLAFSFINAANPGGSWDTALSWSPGTGYDLSAVPINFHAAITMAIDTHEHDFKAGQYCMVHANRGLLKSGTNFRARGLHIDAVISCYPEDPYPNNDVFVVSDSLPTKFYNQAFNLPDHITGDFSEGLHRILEEQASEDHAMTALPYHMVRFDSFAVHTAQQPTEPTTRSFLMVRFC